MKSKALLIQVEQRIFLIRGQKVMLDADLAMLYGVEARSLNQAVARNRQRFPADFMFQLSDAEYENIRSQFVTALGGKKRESSQTVMSSRKHRGHRYRPFAFTEQGVAMLSGVLRSPRAVVPVQPPAVRLQPSSFLPKAGQLFTERSRCVQIRSISRRVSSGCCS